MSFSDENNWRRLEAVTSFVEEFEYSDLDTAKQNADHFTLHGLILLDVVGLDAKFTVFIAVDLVLLGVHCGLVTQ